ncbi:MAG: ankyrin repeat domain-containing protein [Alphaproteobacteria bacterium]|nr:ankyrin repeat domain-containing protein [Alphaproteobacteria bacterium]
MQLSLQDGWTALMVASQKGQVECVTMLVDRGAEVNMQKKVTAGVITTV